MGLDLRGIEIDFAQIARCITLRCVVEVRRCGIAALPAGGDRPRVDPVWTEFDHGDEAVAVGAVPPLGPRLLGCAERGERAPAVGCEPDGDAWRGIAKHALDCRGGAL